MKSSRSISESDIGACWSILWRSVVFVPLLLLMFVTIGGIWLGRWLLPPVVGMFAFADLWVHAGLAALAWLAVFLIYRHFRLSRFHEDPPSLL